MVRDVTEVTVLSSTGLVLGSGGRQKQKGRQRETETDAERERQTERDRQTGRQTETARERGVGWGGVYDS